MIVATFTLNVQKWLREQFNLAMNRKLAGEQVWPTVSTATYNNTPSTACWRDA